MLAIGPGDLLDGDSARPAIDAAHAIAEAHWNVPEGNEVESALGGHVIVGGSSALTV